MKIMSILFIITLIACAYFFYEFRRYQKAYKALVVEQQKAHQKSVDHVYFYTFLFFKMAANANYKRKDFQKVIMETHDNLPVRGGGTKGMGYWENILEPFNIRPVYQQGKYSEFLDEKVMSELADAMWLSYDQDMQRNKAKKESDDN